MTKFTAGFTGAKTPPRLVTLVILAGSSVMPMNIFLPVLPLIGEDLNVSDAVAQYVLTVFLGAIAIAQLAIGPMADRFGRRPVLLVTLSLFLVGTIVCTFAPTIEWLLFGRVLQASSAASIALSRAIVRDLYDREKAASMIGYVTMAMAIIPMLSPSIGGYIGGAFGWRATFGFLIFSGIIVLAVVFLDLGETHTPKRNSIRAQAADYWTLLKEPTVWGYLGTAALASGAYFSFLAGAPLVGLKIVNITPEALGIYFGTVALGYIFGNFLSGRYSERIGIEQMMLYGGITASLAIVVSLWLMLTFEPKAYYLFGPMTLVGMGNGMVLPNANAGAVSVRPDLAGSASGLGGFLQIGGGALLAIAAGNLISVENNAIPLYLIMLLSSVLGTIVSLWMYRHVMRSH